MSSAGLTVLSRYLQSSQGSRHDICKYGTIVSPGTDSKIPMRKVVVPKGDAGQNLERVKKTGISVEVSWDFKIQDPDDHVVIKIAETQEGHHGENIKEDLTDTKNSKVSVRPSNSAERQKPGYPAISLEPSPEDPIDIEAMAPEGEAKDEESAETKSGEGEKSQQVSVKPSPDFESQKPVNPDCIEGGESSGTDKEFILPEQVLLSRKETDSAVAHAKDSKLRHESKPSSVVRQISSSAKQKTKVPKRKEANILSMTSLGVSGGRNKGEMTISKGTRTSANANKKSVMPPSVSLSPKESGTGVSSMNTKKKKLRVVYALKEQVKLQGMNAERSENVKKLDSEQAKSAESDQNNVVSIVPSSSSKDKQIQNSRPPRAYEKKKMMYRPKGIQASGLPPSLSSFLGRKNLRPSLNGLETTQPSLTSVSSLASLESFRNDTSTEHDKTIAIRRKSSSKMMYNDEPKRALIITSNNKHLHGKKLNSREREPVDNRNNDNRKAKVEDCTPRRLKFKQRVNVDNQNSRVEELTPKRLKFRQRVNVDNINGADQNSRVDEFTPKTLKFKPRITSDNRNADNQNSRGKDFTPKKLKFRPRVTADNTNGDNQNSRVKEFKPKRLKFRQRVVAENRNGNNQNCKVEEPSPRTLELVVDNVNADNQNSRDDEFTLTIPELSQQALDNRNADDQNGRGEDSTPRELIFRQKGVDEKKTGYIQSPKTDTRESNSGGKEAGTSCDNDTKIQSEKISLRHRGVNEKKDSGILYNNIIEQTASRFAETKASKVKALVSAFETVISHFDIGISETNDEN
ncbi:hypothetical protein GQ457_04G016000 [Hibiscus cannabinus]